MMNPQRLAKSVYKFVRLSLLPSICTSVRESVRITTVAITGCIHFISRACFFVSRRVFVSLEKDATFSPSISPSILPSLRSQHFVCFYVSMFSHNYSSFSSTAREPSVSSWGRHCGRNAYRTCQLPIFSEKGKNKKGIHHTSYALCY